MEFEEIEIDLPDGYAAYARYWPVPAPRGAVLYLHGIQSHCGWYERSATCLQNAGFAVLQPDRRGSGRNERARGHADSHGQLIDDALACGEILRQRSGHSQYHLMGVSWGGRLAGAMYVVKPQRVLSLSLICPGLFPRVDVTSVEKFKIGLSMLGNRERLYDIPLNDPELFTSVPKWLDFLREDRLSLHQVTASFFLATRRMDSVLTELPKAPSVPLHLFLAGQDKIIDSEKTASFARDLQWAGVQITHYPQARHTLEFEDESEAFFSDLVEWVNSSL